MLYYILYLFYIYIYVYEIYNHRYTCYIHTHPIGSVSLENPNMSIFLCKHTDLEEKSLLYIK